MKIIITLNNETHIINLYNFQYWNQRWFALGQSLDGSIFKKFITTKGFDRVMIESNSGTQFNFKKEHFSPYLCNKEKDIWRESQLIDNNQDLIISDVGPSNFSGKYEFVDNQEGMVFNDRLYFETKNFEAPKFDLLKYQNDDFYYVRYQSINKDKLPQLTNLTDIDLFGKINIIHGVDDNGNDYFDASSLTQICDTDLGFPEKNSIYILTRAIDKCYDKNPSKPTIYHPISIGKNDFLQSISLHPLELDCGNSYIKQNIIKKLTKRKYALRYLYEYFNQINQLTTKRRKISTPIAVGAKDFKKEDFVVHFNNDNASEFKIVYYKDIFSIERKQSLINYVAGDPQFMITGSYDYQQNKILFDNFDSAQQLIHAVRTACGVSQSIHLAKTISTWLAPNYGYCPRIIKLKMSTKANAQAVSNCLSLYSIPIYENDEFYGDTTYVNLYDLFANFGIHIQQIRNVVKMNEFSNALFRALHYEFQVYHISRDYRRDIFKWEMDTELSNCMIGLSSAIHLIRLFNSIGVSKNSYWNSNANQILTAFPNLTDPQSYGVLDYEIFCN